jgi:hypothetical protein
LEWRQAGLKQRLINISRVGDEETAQLSFKYKAKFEPVDNVVVSSLGLDKIINLSARTVTARIPSFLEILLNF